MKVWRWQDSAGTRRTFRGPGTKKDALRLAQQLLNSIRRNAINSGEEDPKLTVKSESMEVTGDSEEPPGGWVPDGALPVDLDKYTKRDDAGEPIRAPAARSPHPLTAEK